MNDKEILQRLRFLYFCEKVFYSRHVVTLKGKHYGVDSLSGRDEFCEVKKDAWNEYSFYPLLMDISDLYSFFVKEDSYFFDNGPIKNDEFIKNLEKYNS